MFLAEVDTVVSPLSALAKTCSGDSMAPRSGTASTLMEAPASSQSLLGFWRCNEEQLRKGTDGEPAGSVGGTRRRSFSDGGAGGSGALLDAVVDDELHDVLEVLRPQALALGLVND